MFSDALLAQYSQLAFADGLHGAQLPVVGVQLAALWPSKSSNSTLEPPLGGSAAILISKLATLNESLSATNFSDCVPAFAATSGIVTVAHRSHPPVFGTTTDPVTGVPPSSR